MNKFRKLEPQTIERLRIAYRFIEGIPDAALRLDAIQMRGKQGTTCGTIACAAGWLTHSPEFKELGLSLPHFQGSGYIGGNLVYKGQSMSWFGAMALVLDADAGLVEDLFCSRVGDEYGFEGTDKALWVRRIELLFKECGEVL